MLNIASLQKEIQAAFDETLPGAFEQALLKTMPTHTEAGDAMAKEFGRTVNDLISESLSNRLAAAIDYHVKSATIYGTLITVGSPFTQTCVVTSPSPMTNGKVPNSLGIM